MRTRRILFVTLCLSAGAACAGMGEAPTVTIDARPLAPEEAREESLAALESGHHRIRLRRTIRVPDRCHVLAGDLVDAAGRLTLRVLAHPEADGCVPEETYLAYTATIDGLRPGRYDLRVVHGYSERRRPSEVVLEHPILVLERSVRVP